MNKRFLSLFLASAMAATSITPAFASEVHVSEAGGTGNSRVTFEVVDTGDPEAPTVFNAYVPVVLPIKMDLDGNITVPTNAVIRNGVENKAIQVEAADVTATGGWQHTDMPTAENGVPNSRLLGLSMNSQDLKAATFPWKIEAAGSLDLNMKAEIPQQQAVNNSEQIATVAFVLDWADENESVISHNWSRDKVLKGSTTPVTISYDATFPGVSVVSVESDNPAVTVEKAPQTYDLGHPGQENWNVHAVSTGNATVTATLNTGETTSFQVVVYELGLEDGGSITVPEIPDKGEGDNLNTGDIIIDIPITTPDGDGTIEVTPIIPPDTILKPGDNEIDVTVMIDNITINITIIINIAGSNPSDGLQQSVAEAQAMGFTFSPYEDGLQIDSFENKQFKKEVNVPEQIGDFKVLKIGDNVFKDQSNLTKITLPNTVKAMGIQVFSSCSNLVEVDLSESLEEIPNSTFLNCTRLLHVDIPESVTLIGTHAFDGCAGLTTVTIPDGITDIKAYTFKDCVSLADVNIPDSITSFGSEAFSGCTSLKKVKMPNSECVVSDYAFEGCESLTLYLHDGITEIASSQFEECVGVSSFVLPDSVTSIGTRAFASCEDLKGINIPDSVSSIGDAAFSNCTKLESCVIPDTATTVGYGVFSTCRGLKSVTLPKGLTLIDTSMFAYCNSLESIDIPSSVTSIGNYAFQECTSLSSVVIPDGVSEIPTAAFKGCTNLKSVVIPKNVSKIRNAAFMGCTSLTTVDIPDAVTYIDAAVFEDCTSLQTIVIPEGVYEIDYQAFDGCTALSSVNVPSSVRNIGSRAFADCTNVTNIVIPDRVRTIEEYAFLRVPHIEYHGSASGAPWGAKSMN